MSNNYELISSYKPKLHSLSTLLIVLLPAESYSRLYNLTLPGKRLQNYGTLVSPVFIYPESPPVVLFILLAYFLDIANFKPPSSFKFFFFLFLL